MLDVVSLKIDSTRMNDVDFAFFFSQIKASLPESVLQNGNMRIIGAEVILVPITKRRSVRQAVS